MFGFPFDKRDVPTFTDEERQFSMEMMTYWGNFAKYGYENIFLNSTVHMTHLDKFLKVMKNLWHLCRDISTPKYLQIKS